MNLRSRWSNFRQRRHPTAARIAIAVACALVAVYGWPLGSVLLGLYSPEPGRYCATPEVFALFTGAVIVAPAALLLGALQIPARRELHDRPPWRTAALAALALLILLVLANWLALIKLVWL
jgi:drug/metabolite transporter (DMT)-like permease